MNLKEQKYVCALAQTGSLTVAAKQLFISQPALSLYIHNLETTLGTPLFERVGKRFILTYAGELYVKNAKQMLDLKMGFDLELASMIKGYRERLRVGMQDIRSNDLTPALITNFYKQFPNVDLIWYEENYSQMEERLLNSQLDLFFGNCAFTRNEFEYIPIYSDRLLFIANKDLPYSIEIPPHASPEISYPWVDLKLFKNERFILQSEGQSIRGFSQQILTECGVHPHNIFTLKKIQTMISLVNQGFGVGFCPQSYLQYTSDKQNIAIHKVGSTKKSIVFSCVYQKNRPLSEYSLWLVEMLKEIMG